ncbi:hypothetical protein DFH06DRAFT_1157997 [Mycena polygramma]|nr:hypothetical protein DFH06DRAFT_1157997 [Mycena polygramma]
MNCFSLNRVQQFEQQGKSPVAMRPCGLLPGIWCNNIFSVVLCNLLLWFGLLLWPSLVRLFLDPYLRLINQGFLLDICSSVYRFPASFLGASSKVCFQISYPESLLTLFLPSPSSSLFAWPAPCVSYPFFSVCPVLCEEIQCARPVSPRTRLDRPLGN